MKFEVFMLQMYNYNLIRWLTPEYKIVFEK